MSSETRLVVYVTAPQDNAPALARMLVEKRLAACVNLVPTVRSIYSWKGEICDDPETLMIIKTRGSLFDALEAAVVEHHPYDVPEVIALPIEAGHQPYLGWLDEVTSSRTV
jgi:periplasmic divalent cation tolerance protein